MVLWNAPAGQQTDNDIHDETGGREDEAGGREEGRGQPVRDSGRAPRLSDNDIFDILRNARRRAVISFLLEEGGRASVKELTEHVVDAEYDTTAGELSSEQYKRVYTALYQSHLPRLDEFGVIDFDKDDTSVALGDAASQVEPYLFPSTGSRSLGIEVAVAVVVASLVALGVFKVGPFGNVSVLTWAMLTVLALFGTAVFQLYQRYG